jgi:5-methylcytosine-specific restriction endonuclease McrA
MPTKARWEKLTLEQKQVYLNATKEHQKKNREYWRELNRKAYVKKVGSLSRISPFENTPEREILRQRTKANNRATRAKLARFPDELTKFVYSEAHELRKLRNNITEIEWHVDHIVPLKGKEVSGLHIWSNFQVIPKQLNLQKGAKYTLHDQWKTRLYTRKQTLQLEGPTEEETQ